MTLLRPCNDFVFIERCDGNMIWIVTRRYSRFLLEQTNVKSIRLLPSRYPTSFPAPILNSHDPPARMDQIVEGQSLLHLQASLAL